MLGSREIKRKKIGNKDLSSHQNEVMGWDCIQGKVVMRDVLVISVL